MKAAIRRTYGSPNAIRVESIKHSTPGKDEVLVAVYATTVNRTDCANLTARPFIMRFILGLFRPRQIILGTDFAGKILQCGPEVKSLTTGMDVFGFKDTGLGSQAQSLVVKEDQLYRFPDRLNYKQAAASIEGAHYAYSFIKKANVQAGQKIFINGASGAIGSALLQLLGQYNVEIAASCNTKNITLIASLGADKVYDYTKEDFTKDDQQYDFIFDAVGKSTFGKCKRLLKKGGLYISSEMGPYAQNIFYAFYTSVFVSKKKVRIPVPYPVKQSMPYIIDALENMNYTPLIDREYPLDQISDAYSYVIKGQKTGNVIVTMMS
ncbi:MAG: NAD(P)-dependent alcohol dehydrogenase [Eudoraea sp.]|nr:NAD(P)-dependent alcohol dehydrogenase [Eudoraea sp.]